MNTALIEFLLGLYFIGASLPALVTTPVSRGAVVELIYGIILVGLAIVGLAIAGGLSLR